MCTTVVQYGCGWFDNGSSCSSRVIQRRKGVAAGGGELVTPKKREGGKKARLSSFIIRHSFLFLNSRRMAKNKRKALSAIDKNIVKSQALDLKPSKSNRVNSKARASDVFEPRSKNRIQYVSVSLSESSELQ
jgi:hypothetical protein